LKDFLGHYQGILLGAARGMMAERGMRGPVSSFLFLNLRLLNNQTLENATGVGAPPWTWPVDEQVIDLLHKGIYAFVPGAVADELISGPPDVPAAPQPWQERSKHEPWEPVREQTFLHHVCSRTGHVASFDETSVLLTSA
jgi:hypothetical protein